MTTDVVRSDFKDGEPRIQDLELARRLGYTRPRAIRDLIKSLIRDGFLSNFEFCRAPGQKPDPQGRGRPTKEFWLNEPGALAVILKSETAIAKQIFREVRDLFIAVRRGELAPRQPDCPLLLDVPREWSRMWQPSLDRALCRLARVPFREASRGRAWLAPIRAQIYRLLMGGHGYDLVKARNPKPQRGSNHHQLLADLPWSNLPIHLAQVELFAKTSTSLVDFWARMNSAYAGAALQMPLPGAAQ